MLSQAPLVHGGNVLARRSDRPATVVSAASVTGPARDGGLTGQLAHYGELFVVRFARLRHAFAVSHADVAQALEISLDSLRRLSTGEQVTLDDPHACRRLVRLEEVAQRLDGAQWSAVTRRRLFHTVALETSTSVTRETIVLASRVRELGGRTVELALVATATQEMGWPASCE